VEGHAASFLVVCTDGSYPLAWTDLHREYRELFDRQLTSVVQEEGFSREDFREYCEDLRQAAAGLDAEAPLPGASGVRVAEFWDFVRSLTASEDFDRFLSIMFGAAALLHNHTLHAGGVDEYPVGAQQSPQEVEVEVTVPAGVASGEPMAVEYLGHQFHLLVPEGCIPGTTFRALLTLPAGVPGAA